MKIISIILVILSLILFLYYKKRKKYFLCLMYHNISKNSNIEITTKEFEKHMETIKNKKTFKMEELEKLEYKLPENSILVTFDDGYKSNYTEAFPILKKFGIKATIFLNTKYIGNDDFYLNWDEIEEMYKSGLIDFQLHTHSHGLTIKKIKVNGYYNENTSQYFKRESYNLFYKEIYKEENDEKLYGLPIFKVVSQISLKGYKLKENFIENFRKLTDEDKKNINKFFINNKKKYFEKINKKEFDKILEFEILENKKIIEEKLKKKANVLAYPWGHRYKGRKSKFKKFGVDVLVTTREGVNKLKINRKNICRISGDKFKEISKFEKELENKKSSLYRKILKLKGKK